MINRHGIFGQLFAPLICVMTLGGAAPALAADLYVLPTDGRPLPDHVAPLTLDTHPEPKHKACDLLFDGQIEDGDLDQFKTLFGYQDHPEYGTIYDGFNDDAVLCLSSPGGDLNEALAIVDFLETMDSGLETRVLSGDTCASACTMLFLAGNYYFEGESIDRIVSRSIEPTARLGFHAPRIVMGNDGPFPKEQVENAYARAVRIAAKVFDFSHRRDTDGQAFMTPYLFTRMLETPPQDMYYIDTVGDALLGDVAVTGVEVRATLDRQLIHTICSNAFILDDGLFDWAFGSGWKRHPLAPLPEILREFIDLMEAPRDYEQIRYSQDVLIETQDNLIYGVAKGFPGGGPYYAQDCLVRFDSYDEVGKTVTLANLRNAWDAGRNTLPVEIMVAPQYPQSDHSEPAPKHTNSPHAYWQHHASTEEARLHSYPWLITYSMAVWLKDLPRLAPRDAETRPRTASIPIQTTTPAAVPETTCDSLWFQRNLIFHRNGYCFGGKRGQEVFGNEGCHTKSPQLSAGETAQMNQIKSAEKELGCR
ncbi:hypothetical protein TRL7639_00393 [Falsiruegeria litorea R37]|uniref:YARHG domain-containing protein n=1 Tax=Falsiruegeria litorea R37 TaxID=1200284 RepID=A0A1Y5RN22_9RHOB|nr:YARHG domain-containing protein [Falsiruegeria litorea]SLN18748.1 hypothetical protein TRL7639_00393 [Falsiruegeria litorea R37]